MAPPPFRARAHPPAASNATAATTTATIRPGRRTSASPNSTRRAGPSSGCEAPTRSASPPAATCCGHRRLIPPGPSYRGRYVGLSMSERIATSNDDRRAAAGAAEPPRRHTPSPDERHPADPKAKVDARHAWQTRFSEMNAAARRPHSMRQQRPCPPARTRFSRINPESSQLQRDADHGYPVDGWTSSFAFTRPAAATAAAASAQASATASKTGV